MQYDIQDVVMQDQEDLYSGSAEGATASAEFGRLTQLDATVAKHPMYANRIERLDSFKRWPKPKIDVEEIAEAGLFYSGEDDGTDCYFCGIHISLWHIHDAPWIEHARFSQDCQYLLFHKGWAFIKASLEFYDLPTTNIQLKWTSCSGRSYSTTVITPPVSQPTCSSQPTPAPRPKRIIRRVEPREIRSRLDLDNTKKLMMLGYPRELVGQVIGENLQTEADDFETYGDLVRAVMSAAEMLGITPVHTPINSQGSLSSASYSNVTSKQLLGAANTPVTPPSGSADNVDPAVAKAMEVNKNLKKKLYCKKCWKKEVNVVLLNCGDMVLCEDCAKLVHICPQCHQHIVQRVKVFLA